MATKIDKSQIAKVTVGLDGESVEAYVFPVVIPLTDVVGHKTAYNGNGDPPPQVGKIAKLVLDALLEQE